MREALFQNLLHSVVGESSLFKVHARSWYFAPIHRDLVLAAIGLDLGGAAVGSVGMGDVEVLLERCQRDVSPADLT